MDKDWRSWEVGRKTVFEGKDFDGKFHFEGVVTEVFSDHLIVEADGMTLWVDDNTVKDFS